MSSAPPLSVILVHDRGSDRLDATLASLRAQRGVETERLGASLNAAAAADFAARSADIAVPPDAAPAPDRISAINRALRAATGEWVLVVTSGDRLVGDLVLSECLNWMRKTEAGIVVAEVACDDGRIVKMAAAANPIAGPFLPESGTFYRRTLFAENGDFDAACGPAAAYEFHLRLWKSRIRFKPIPLRAVATDRLPGDEAPRWAACRAERLARRRYFSFGRAWRWDLAALLGCLRPGRRR